MVGPLGKNTPRLIRNSRRKKEDPSLRNDQIREGTETIRNDWLEAKGRGLDEATWEDQLTTRVGLGV